MGAGPAGLTAAYELCKAGMASIVLEKDAEIGGLSRTVSYKGYGFDIGGHRFFTEVRAVEDMWREVLPASQFLRRKKFDPIKLMDENKTVAGTNMGHLFDHLHLLRPQFEALIAMYQRGDIKPQVDRTFSFSEAAAAHHYIHDRKAKGKVLLVP